MLELMCCFLSQWLWQNCLLYIRKLLRIFCHLFQISHRCLIKLLILLVVCSLCAFFWMIDLKFDIVSIINYSLHAFPRYDLNLDFNNYKNVLVVDISNSRTSTWIHILWWWWEKKYAIQREWINTRYNKNCDEWAKLIGSGNVQIDKRWKAL